MERNNQKKSSGLFAGLFCALAGVAIGVGSKLIYDEVTKEEKEDDKKRQLALEEIRKKNAQERHEKEVIQGETLSDVEYESFFCPISQEVMKDPVITPYGVSYDRQSILSWLKKNNTCPITKNILSEKDLITNYALKNTIEDYLSKQK